MKCVKFGGCSIYYIYILLTILFFFLKSSILSCSEVSVKTLLNVFGIETVLYRHGLMQLLVEYIGYIIYGGIFLIILKKNKIFNKKEKEEKKEKEPKNEEFIQKNSELIYFEEHNVHISDKAPKLILIACALFAFQLIIKKIMYILNLWMFDLWIFNIIFISLFMKKILKIEIYKHQLYALVFNFGINLILLISESLLKGKNGKNDYDIVENQFGNYFYNILFYIVFLALAAILSLSQVLQKQLMDLEYISPFKILFIIGIFCTFFTLITLIITTFVSCNEKLKEKELCPLVQEDMNNITYYFDSFKIFKDNLAYQYENDKKAFFIEIFLVYPLYPLVCYLKHFCEIMIIYQLNPIYILISDTIYYGITKLIALVYIYNEIFIYMEISKEIISLFGYAIYLEIIEFKCFNMNFNTRININERGKIESIGIGDNFDDEEDETLSNNAKDI